MHSEDRTHENRQCAREGRTERAWEDHMLGSGHSTGRMVAGLYLCRGCRKMLTGS